MEKNSHIFVSELEAAQRLKPAHGAIILLMTIAAFFIFLVVYSAFAKIDERTRGQGQVMPSSDTQIVQSLEGGIVTEILAREGDLVKKGDILMRIDDVLFASEEGGIEARMQGLQIRQTRLAAEARGEAAADRVLAVGPCPHDSAGTRGRMQPSHQQQFADCVPSMK